ncbi:hypothetical protein Q31b_02540 [Novipirellula aureliae]|uniref:Uncharacterized protein n=1 Tax=Novipirellula aureliae TaxID=2527966 RepID=A0A5C6E5Y9_9BACT|nr:DUF6544 family protein [Novipirellula aureliae]TWU45083.1 hypothetical protein Q31b_02540 [Novipirellula aureliae]
MTRPDSIIKFARRCLGEKAVGALGVRIHQRGEIRLGSTKPWMPFRAEQTMSASSVEFRWQARFRMAGFIPGSVVDCFENGRGALDAWLCGLIRVAHARGPKVDRGEAQRYLAELAWCPMALLQNQSLRFEELSKAQVRVSVIDDETHVDLLFDDNGEIVAAKTLTRFRDDEIQPWEGRFENYRDFGPLRLPSKAEVAWDAPEGRFVYWRANIDDAILLS